MATKYHHDLTLCRKMSGISIGRVCATHDGRCILCDSFVEMETRARICDECGLGASQGRCIICNAPGASDAFYCRVCTVMEKDVSLIFAKRTKEAVTDSDDNIF